MNIKFRMPKFGRKQSGGSVLKELLLTTLATTISIVLTFGTAHCIDQHQADQSRRLMALTIINDIDQSLNVIKRYIEEDENGRNITLYLMENMDRLDSVSEDTLNLFIEYVTPSTFDIDMEFKKNNETIFNSSQDTWRTLNDKKFFDNVQNFYSYRATFERERRESAIFQKPVTAEELSQMLLDTDEMSSHKGKVEVCRRLLNSMKVKRYVDLYAERVKNYQFYLMIFFNQNEENKFLMNITEQEMNDFVNQTYKTVRPVKEKELVGTWEAAYPNDSYQATFEYRKDHTFTANYAVHWSDAAIIGKMIQRYSISGTWTVEGDSLVKVFDPSSFKMEIDENGATYHPDQADAVEQLKKEMSKMPSGMASRAVQGTNIDESGTRLQLNEPGWGSTNYRKVQ
ncbi:MAG: hypothetical protein J6X70_07560 [Muribaculaceae bacterium]|nr:hypothetical protein [Muribaculaceae bacterium]